MAIVIDIDEKGNRVEKLGGVVMHRDNFNAHCDGAAYATAFYVSYAPKNFHVVKISGHFKDGTKFDIESAPTDPAIPLATIVQQMAEKLLQGKTNAVSNG